MSKFFIYHLAGLIVWSARIYAGAQARGQSDRTPIILERAPAIY